MSRLRRSVCLTATALMLSTGPAVTTASSASTAPAAPAAPAAGQVQAGRTSPTEARRLDRLPTPKLGWYRCWDYAECATVRVPRDYDEPTGATVELALMRVRATDPAHRVGTLFLGPEELGDQATLAAYHSPHFLGDDLRARFDIVGVDPRGVGFSDTIRCFRDTGEQYKVFKHRLVPFPLTPAQERAYVAAGRQIARSCSSSARPLAGAMSTAQNARDLELLRRAVGDRGLTFFGRGYGTYLGQVYANLFPERVRAMVLDGPVDPIALVGTKATAERPMYDRLGSPAASWSALREMLLRCDKAGRRCAFAAGDPLKRLAELARRLKARPLVLPDPVTERPQPFGYADLVERLAAGLRDAEGWMQVSDMLAELWTLTQPSGAVAPARRAAAATGLAVERTKVRARAAERAQAARRFGPDPGTQTFEYDNRLEAFSGVTCSDGWHGANPDSWRLRAAEADRRVPYFGRLWAWSTVQCARSAWTARDEDAYRGPFTRRTASPVLVVGGRWNPVTGYPAARTVARLLPGSRLLLSDSWGDQAYFTSTCATTAVERYLIGGRLPKAGTVCRGKDQPYTTSEGRSLRSAASTTPSAARTPRGGVQ